MLGCTVAESAFGTTLCLPGDLLPHLDPTTAPIHSDYTQGLLDFFNHIPPVIQCTHGLEAVFVSPAFQNCTHVSLREGRRKPPLTIACVEVFAVLEMTESTATTKLR